MIPIYNRYVGNTGKYYRVDEPYPVHSAPKRANVTSPAHKREERKPSAGKADGLNGLLSSFLPAGLDAGDILLLLILLLLYIESKDEEFLIILIVVGMSLFKK